MRRICSPLVAEGLDYIRFLVDSSVGELEVQFFEDGWAGIDLPSRGRDVLSVEDRMRNSDDLAEGFKSMGVPGPEAKELATELWSQLVED